MPDVPAESTDRSPAPTAADPWACFECALEACIGALEPNEILILSRCTANQYIQLFHKGDTMLVEAASNAYITPPPFLLNRRQYQRALDMGWMPPTMSGEDFDALQHQRALGLVEQDDENDGAPHESPNFHMIFPVGAPHLTGFVIETLRRVYKIRKPAELQYQSFEADDGTLIRWPTLGLPRSPFDPSAPAEGDAT